MQRNIDAILGIELDDDSGDNDGTYYDHQYFVCDPYKGIFVNRNKFLKANTISFGLTDSSISCLPDLRIIVGITIHISKNTDIIEMYLSFDDKELVFMVNGKLVKTQKISNKISYRGCIKMYKKGIRISLL